MRRTLLALLVLLFAATPAFADDVQKKHHVDQQISALNARVAKQKQQAHQLQHVVDGYTSQIRALEARVGDVSLKLSTLNTDLELHQRRLDALNRLFALQTSRYRYLQQQYRQAVAVLEHRFVALYEQGQTTSLEVVFGASNLQSAIDEVQYLHQLSRNDRRIADAVRASRKRAHSSSLRSQ